MKSRTEELKELGVLLQQSLALTRIRVEKLNASPLRARALRVLQQGQGTFDHIGELVRTAQRTTDFMNRTFNMQIIDMFSSFVSPRTNQLITSVGYELVINRVRMVIDELAKLNRDIDKDEQHGTNSKK